MSTCGPFLALKVSGGKRAPNVSAQPLELINITRLQTLLKLVMAVLFASALPVCSPMPLLASPLPLWTSVDIFRYWWAVLWSRPPPVWICSCLLPLPSCMDPAPWLTGAALCCPTFLSCVDLHSDWFVPLSLVLDLTMWPRLLWHHMVPSSARDRRAHAHLPLPANHIPWSKKMKG